MAARRGAARLATVLDAVRRGRRGRGDTGVGRRPRPGGPARTRQLHRRRPGRLVVSASRRSKDCVVAHTMLGIELRGLGAEQLRVEAYVGGQWRPVGLSNQGGDDDDHAAGAAGQADALRQEVHRDPVPGHLPRRGALGHDDHRGPGLRRRRAGAGPQGGHRRVIGRKAASPTASASASPTPAAVADDQRPRRPRHAGPLAPRPNPDRRRRSRVRHRGDAARRRHGGDRGRAAGAAAAPQPRRPRSAGRRRQLPGGGGYPPLPGGGGPPVVPGSTRAGFTGPVGSSRGPRPVATPPSCYQRRPAAGGDAPL